MQKQQVSPTFVHDIYKKKYFSASRGPNEFVGAQLEDTKQDVTLRGVILVAGLRGESCCMEGRHFFPPFSFNSSPSVPRSPPHERILTAEYPIEPESPPTCSVRDSQLSVALVRVGGGCQLVHRRYIWEPARSLRRNKAQLRSTRASPKRFLIRCCAVCTFVCCYSGWLFFHLSTMRKCDTVRYV